MIFCFKDSFKKKLTGFTVLEMLIVVFIIMLLSGIVFANYRGGGREFALQRSSSKLAQDFRISQSLVGKGWEECMTVGNYHEDYEYGYGIFFNSNTPKVYFVFADCHGTRDYRSEEHTV